MNEADQHLLRLVQAGDHDGWNQFVARFQRRLMGFARQQIGQEATAEDLVQETFLSFLKAVADYRQDCELESFLFQILRRRIVDHYRKQGRNKEVLACNFRGATPDFTPNDPLQTATAHDMQASWYARHSETQDTLRQALASAIASLTSWLHTGRKFRDLKIAEGLFYAGIRNQDLATTMNVSEAEVNQVKHRLVKRLKDSVTASDILDDDAPTDASFRHLLASIWETQRPSCPKRSTLGKFTLGILPPDWDDFVQFHVSTLGCTFCNANLDELSAEDAPKEDGSCNNRIFQSTVGFLKPRSPDP